MIREEPGRAGLDVPYWDEDTVKAAGARWDRRGLELSDPRCRGQPNFNATDDFCGPQSFARLRPLGPGSAPRCLRRRDLISPAARRGRASRTSPPASGRLDSD